MAKTDRTAKREKLAAALLHAPSLKAAADEVGVSYSTARRIVADPAIAEQVNEAKAASLEAACAELKASVSGAVATLREISQSAEVSASTRAYAAQTLLQYALPFHKAVELEKRIAELESITEEGANG